jgi:hypothetical protein
VRNGGGLGTHRELTLGGVLEALGVALVDGDDGGREARRTGRPWG